MPTWRRTVSIAFTSSLSSMPSTVSWPSWCSSSRLMQRISVDLPEPDGPQMTMRSPRATAQVDVAQHVEVVAVPLVDLVEVDDGVGHGVPVSSQRVRLTLSCRSTHRL